MAKRKLTKAEQDEFEAQRRRGKENSRRLLELAERGQARLDAQQSRADAARIVVHASEPGRPHVSVILTEREAEDLARALQSHVKGEASSRDLRVEDGKGAELTIGLLAGD